jgi:DNA-binding transcriptional MocR family regulator
MSDFIYRKICNEIIQAIRAGTLHEGEKLDSLRKLANKRQVGVSTISHAYAELEIAGWIYAVEKKGYFVSNKYGQLVSKTSQSYGDSFLNYKELTKLPLENALQYSFNDPNILPLSCTAPSTVVDAENLLNQLHRKAIKHRPYRMLMQDPIEGIKPLREEIAKHYLNSGQIIVQKDILITNGRKDGLSTVIHALKLQKSCIAIEAPSSFFFQSIIKQYDITTTAVPMQPDFSNELELLNQAFQAEPFSAYLFNPNFNDPTGRVLTLDEKEKLIAWAEKNGVALIEYDRSELHFSGQRPKSVSSLLTPDSKCKVVSIVDFYDTISPSISLGYIICRNTYQECLFAKQINSEEPSICLQNIIFEMLRSGKYQKFVNNVRKQLAVQCDKLRLALKAHTAGVLIINEPKGGPCLWVALPQGYSSQDLWHYLIKYNLAIAPGCMFISSIKFDNYFRVTYGLPWDAKMQVGVVNLAKYLNTFIESNSIIKRTENI